MVAVVICRIFAECGKLDSEVIRDEDEASALGHLCNDDTLRLNIEYGRSGGLVQACFWQSRQAWDWDLHYEGVPKKCWTWLAIPGFGLVLWGCTHLARSKGFPSTAAYGLSLFALAVAAVAGWSKTPLNLGTISVFVNLLPTVVLLVLPKRPGYLRRW